MTTAITRRAGGKPVHGVQLGIIILDTRFERVPGDVGHAGSFPFPVQYEVANGYRKGSLLKPEDPAVLEEFLRAADKLIAQGVAGIATSCGFLSIFQPYLTERLGVPVATSSLLQVPLVQQLLPRGRRVGVLTANAANLTPAHFTAVGAPGDTPFAGLNPEGVFRANLTQGNPSIDRAAHEADVLEAAERLLAAQPDIGALVLECTNLSPYSSALEKRFGLPVYDILSLLHWFQAGLRPPRHAHEG